jgi:hypothetical protein
MRHKRLTKVLHGVGCGLTFHRSQTNGLRPRAFEYEAEALDQEGLVQPGIAVDLPTGLLRRAKAAFARREITARSFSARAAHRYSRMARPARRQERRLLRYEAANEMQVRDSRSILASSHGSLRTLLGLTRMAHPSQGRGKLFCRGSSTPTAAEARDRPTSRVQQCA